MRDIFCCPYCKGELDNYRCNKCDLTFSCRNDIYYFFDPSAPHWQKVIGIERYMQKKYNNIDLEDLEKQKVYNVYQGYEAEPYKSAGTHINAQANSAMLNYAFDVMQGVLREDDDSYIIVIGARSHWESYFLARYKPVIAIDIVDDTRYINPVYGKGITRVVCDGMYLPLKKEIASIIFLNSTYHHMEDKERALREWYRVLRQSGLLVANGEYFCPPKDLGSQEYMGEYSYTYEMFQKLVNESQFTTIELFPISYSENMEYKMGIELTGKPDNGIIVGVK